MRLHPSVPRRHTTRRQFLRFATATSGLLLLAACGPAAPASKPAEGSATKPAESGASKPAQGAAPGAAAPGAAAPGAAPTAAAGGPAAGAATSAPAARPVAASGQITIGIPNEPATLDPMFGVGTMEYNVLVNVMDGLFTTGEHLAVVPRLAESYRQIDDMNWEFKLRQGVTFHNGEPFNADAVKATYDRSMDKAQKPRNTWAADVNVDRVDVVDPYTVRFHTTTATPHMLARLANDHFIFPPKYLAESDARAIARKPIGTGAYVFKEWASGDKIVLEANPNYWDTDKPAIKTITWRWTPEHAARLANLKTGAIDLMDQLDPTSIAEVDADSHIRSLSTPGGRRVFAGFNLKVEPFEKLEVRQALNYGTNVESIAKAILGGATTRMRTWVNPPVENPEVKGYTYDPAKAKELLQKAGLGQGFKVTFDVDRSAYMKGDEFPQAIASSLRDIGVDVTINQVERTVAAQMQKERKTNGMYMRSTAPFFDPGLDFDLMRLNHAGNSMQWEDPEFLDLMKKMYSGGTPDERKAWSFQAQARMSEQAPMLFLWKQPEIYGASRKLQGFTPTGDERIRVARMTLTG
ncbi:MAG: ABC transporter substrate-binding protein [Chloroflexi bacterium]|nr:ABC transporter substrate-binding protein [Chloroflexota bacterium]